MENSLSIIELKNGQRNIYYVYTDHLGSTHAITNASGTILERHNFDAWGRERNPQTWQYISFYTNSTRKTWMGIDPNNNFNISKENGGNILFNGANVGIGTENPQSKLEVYGDDLIGQLTVHTSSGSINRKSGINFKVDNVNLWQVYTDNSDDQNTFHIKYLTDDNNRVFSIKTNGNVGIGKINPTEKLEVNGKIRTSEVLITLDNWKDCVFYDNYNLMPLPELEVYINQNKHLPDVLSEKEILETGLPAGEMAKMQMQKIEELTLYIIELNKIVQKQQEEIEKLKVKK
jgi:hypothetical protein